jgi:hypothetical protein
MVGFDIKRSRAQGYNEGYVAGVKSTETIWRNRLADEGTMCNHAQAEVATKAYNMGQKAIFDVCMSQLKRIQKAQDDRLKGYYHRNQWTAPDQYTITPGGIKP